MEEITELRGHNPKGTRRALSPSERMLDAYFIFYGKTDRDAPDFPISVYAPGWGAAKRSFKSLLDQGVTLELLPFWLCDVERYGPYQFDRGKNGYPSLWTIQQAALNNTGLTKRFLADMGSRAGYDGSLKPSPWTSEYYGDDRVYMTRERLLMLRRTGKMNPAQWWRDNKHIYDENASRPSHQPVWYDNPNLMKIP